MSGIHPRIYGNINPLEHSHQTFSSVNKTFPCDNEVNFHARLCVFFSGKVKKNCAEKCKFSPKSSLVYGIHDSNDFLVDVKCHITLQVSTWCGGV